MSEINKTELKTRYDVLKTLFYEIKSDLKNITPNSKEHYDAVIVLSAINLEMKDIRRKLHFNGDNLREGFARLIAGDSEEDIAIGKNKKM